MSNDPKIWRPDDNVGMGMIDGEIVTLTPEQYAKAVIERNAEESEEPDVDEDDDLDDEE